MNKESDKKGKKGKTYIVCLGTFTCHLYRVIDRMGIENTHVWMTFGNDHGFLSSCIQHCDIKDRFILLAKGNKEILEEESEYRLMKSLHQYNKREIIKIYEQLMLLYGQLSWKNRIKS